MTEESEEGNVIDINSEDPNKLNFEIDYIRTPLKATYASSLDKLQK